MSWGIVASAGIGLIGGMMNSGAQQSEQQQQNQYTQQDQELNFQRQAWLAQQQRAWQLQDRQFKQQSIAEFRGDWGHNQDNIKPVNQDKELASLDQFDPNKLGSVGPTNYGSTPVATGGAGGTGPSMGTLPGLGVQ